MSRRAMLIEALGATSRDLERMLRRVTPEAARRRPAPADWSIANVLAHLIYAEQLYQGRLRRIVEQDEPHEPPLPPDPGEHDLSVAAHELLQTFTTRRSATIAFLSGLTQHDWARTFIHPTMGRSRLRDQVQAMVSHDNEHLEQIMALREQPAHAEV